MTRLTQTIRTWKNGMKNTTRVTLWAGAWTAFSIAAFVGGDSTIGAAASVCAVVHICTAHILSELHSLPLPSAPLEKEAE